MNKSTSRWRLISLAVFALLLGGFLWNRDQRPKPANGIETTDQGQGEIPSHPDDPTTQASPQNAALGQRASPKTNPPTPIEKRLQQLADAPNYMNVPISFYGRVIDQDQNPLPGVRVVVSLRQWTYISGPGLNTRHPKTELITDVAGRFEFSNGGGDSLSIEALEKEGYEPEPKALRSFGYTTSDPLRPDPNNPIVFHMWKAETKAQLVTGSKRFSLVPDGRTYTIDLLAGAITESVDAEGDLRVSLRRPETAAWGQRYDWTLDVQAINGGLVEETNGISAMFRAPEDGYASKWRLDAKAADEPWSYGTGQKRFYVKSRGGRNYGRLELEAYAYYLQNKQGRFNLIWAVNPAGDRLLR